MTVYVLTEVLDAGDINYVIGVYSSKELAEEAALIKRGNSILVDYEVEAFQLDLIPIVFK